MSNSPEDMIKDLLNDPEAMNKINSMISSLSGDEKNKGSSDEKSESDFLNPETIMKISSMFNKISNEDDPRINLLLALRPYMNQKRKDKTEHAIKILKMSKMSSLLGDLNIL